MATREACVHFNPEDGLCELRKLSLGNERPRLLNQTSGQCRAGFEVIIAGVKRFEPNEVAQKTSCNKFEAIRDAFPPTSDI